MVAVADRARGENCCKCFSLAVRLKSLHGQSLFLPLKFSLMSTVCVCVSVCVSVSVRVRERVCQCFCLNVSWADVISLMPGARSI